MSENRKKILITGGTGFIGKHLCNRLLKEGHTIYTLTRYGKKTSQDTHEKEIYFTNLDKIKDIDIDIVVNLAGETIAQRWTGDAKRKIYDSRISITQELVKFMQCKTNKPLLFISGSAVGYYGVSQDQAFTEESYPSTGKANFTSLLCKKWEEEALHAASLGIRTVLLRTAPVLEKDGGMLAKLLPSFRLGLGSQIASGQQWISWIDRDDLIELILFIIEQDSIEGPINATSPHPISNKDFSQALAKALYKPCFLVMPASILKIIFGEMAEEMMINGQKVLPAKALGHGFKFTYPTIQQSLAKIFPM